MSLDLFGVNLSNFAYIIWLKEFVWCVLVSLVRHFEENTREGPNWVIEGGWHRGLGKGQGRKARSVEVLCGRPTWVSGHDGITENP